MERWGYNYGKIFFNFVFPNSNVTLGKKEKRKGKNINKL
jgi:hypothetical protein